MFRFFLCWTKIQLHFVCLFFVYGEFDSLIFFTASWYFISFPHFPPWIWYQTFLSEETPAWIYFYIVLWKYSEKKILLLFVHHQKEKYNSKKAFYLLKFPTQKINTVLWPRFEIICSWWFFPLKRRIWKIPWRFFFTQKLSLLILNGWPQSEWVSGRQIILLERT